MKKFENPEIERILLATEAIATTGNEDDGSQGGDNPFT